MTDISRKRSRTTFDEGGGHLQEQGSQNESQRAACRRRAPSEDSAPCNGCADGEDDSSRAGAWRRRHRPTAESGAQGRREKRGRSMGTHGADTNSELANHQRALRAKERLDSLRRRIQAKSAAPQIAVPQLQNREDQRGVVGAPTTPLLDPQLYPEGADPAREERTGCGCGGRLHEACARRVKRRVETGDWSGSALERSAAPTEEPSRGRGWADPVTLNQTHTVVVGVDGPQGHSSCADAQLSNAGRPRESHVTQPHTSSSAADGELADPAVARLRATEDSAFHHTSHHRHLRDALELNSLPNKDPVGQREGSRPRLKQEEQAADPPLARHLSAARERSDGGRQPGHRVPRVLEREAPVPKRRKADTSTAALGARGLSPPRAARPVSHGDGGAASPEEHQAERTRRRPFS